MLNCDVAASNARLWCEYIRRANEHNRRRLRERYEHDRRAGIRLVVGLACSGHVIHGMQATLALVPCPHMTACMYYELCCQKFGQLNCVVALHAKWGSNGRSTRCAVNSLVSLTVFRDACNVGTQRQERTFGFKAHIPKLYALAWMSSQQRLSNLLCSSLAEVVHEELDFASRTWTSQPPSMRARGQH